MKIGILSMQQINNYGSLLQAYSLKKIIEDIDCNCEVFFVDFDIQNSILINTNLCTKKNKFNEINPLIIVRKIIFKIKKQKLIKIFSQFRIKELDINKAYNDCDILVVGSDEVFGCPNIIRKDFFGGYPYAKKQITFAASCGNTKYDDIPLIHREDLRILLKNFNSLSVRDIGTYNFLSQFACKDVFFHLDPVLIGELSKREHKKVKEKSYLIVYAYHERIKDPTEIKNIKKFAKKKGLKIIHLGASQKWGGKFIVPNPFEMLDYFYNAEYVITDTFHGCIFSIINHVKFGVYVRDNNSNKISDLLTRLKLKDRTLNNQNFLDFQMVLEKNINFDFVDNIIDEEKENAIEYLRKQIQSKEEQ